MATPKSIKTVAVSLVKNTRSPRNQFFLDVPSPKYFTTPKRDTRSPVSRKRLNFTQNLNVLGTNNVFIFDEDVSKNTSKGSINIDTPTKSDLMKNGLANRRKIVDILGKGTFGTVVKGFYKNNLVAAKITREIEKNVIPSDINAKELSHENIVKVLDVVMRPEGEYAIVLMEYLEEAKNLQSVIETGHISNFTKRKYIEQLCKGLKYCHSSGILHLDLKPKNILVLSNQQCKICDFGNSCKVANKENYVYQGTVAYAAPELLRGLEPTEFCDIYSLGVTIWQIEYRKSPYENWSSSKCLLYHVVKNNIRPEYEARNDSITEIFTRCWIENPLLRLELDQILKML